MTIYAIHAKPQLCSGSGDNDIKGIYGDGPNTYQTMLADC
jgi:hypothetical protein